MTSGVIPRPARLWQVPSLLGVLWAFTRQTDWLPCVRSRWTDAELMVRIIRRGWVRQWRSAAFIARDGARIHGLYVHPALRGRGLGAALIRDAKADADRLELWVLARNAAARRFYAAQGFAEVICCPQGMGNDEGLPDILMVWEREAMV